MIERKMHKRHIEWDRLMYDFGRQRCFWTNATLNGETSPYLYLAVGLAKRGYNVKIKQEAFANDGALLPNHVAIHSDARGQSILNRIAGTPELHAMTLSPDERFDKLFVEALASSKWDHETKRSIYARRLLNRASTYVERGNVNNHEKQIANINRAKNLLDGIEPLTEEHIGILVEDVLLRELSHSQG